MNLQYKNNMNCLMFYMWMGCIVFVNEGEYEIWDSKLVTLGMNGVFCKKAGARVRIQMLL